MRDRLNELGDDTQVVLVTFTTANNIAGYQNTNQLPFPILLDPDRSVYRSYGLGRGSIGRVWGWKAARRYMDLFRAQGMSGLRAPTEDTLQLGGDFVIDPDGNLAYGFWGQGPDDRPSIDHLVTAIRSSTP